VPTFGSPSTVELPVGPRILIPEFAY
jgi:hypothetical protein